MLATNIYDFCLYDCESLNLCEAPHSSIRLCASIRPPKGPKLIPTVVIIVIIFVRYEYGRDGPLWGRRSALFSPPRVIGGVFACGGRLGDATAARILEGFDDCAGGGGRSTYMYVPGGEMSLLSLFYTVAILIIIYYNLRIN
jgi:hypothetical protein